MGNEWNQLTGMGSWDLTDRNGNRNEWNTRLWTPENPASRLQTPQKSVEPTDIVIFSIAARLVFFSRRRASPTKKWCFFIDLSGRLKSNGGNDLGALKNIGRCEV
jgi:hypothetical protein